MNLYGIVVFVYMILALKQFFRQGWGATVLKAIAIQLLYYIAMFALILIGVVYFFMT
jgi:hypothetical protein